MTSGTSLFMRRALEFETTAQPASAKRGSRSAAMAASRAAKMTLGAPSGWAGETRISATRLGMGVFIRQRAASPYRRPSERSEAASQATSNQGWCSSICTKRCPTMPVAPRIPTGVFDDMIRLILQQGLLMRRVGDRQKNQSFPANVDWESREYIYRVLARQQPAESHP